MSTIDAAELLDAWERGGQSSPGERGLALLAFARPDVPSDALEAWSVGRRDAALLALHEQAFGPRLRAIATCPECADQLETEFDAADVVVGAVPRDNATRTLDAGDYRVTFRLPSAGDLARLGAVEALAAPERWLLERCVVDASRGDEPCGAADLPADVVEAVDAAMADADPQAEIELALQCPACGRSWQSMFDIVAFLWREIEAHAPRVLQEVATLASAFGWSEREILALSPWRRHRYLELAGG